MRSGNQLVAIFLGLMFIAASPALAGKKPLVPASLDGVEIVSLDKLNSLLKSKKVGKDFMLYDSRKSSDYEAGRISGAAHMPVPGKPDLGSAELEKATGKMAGKLPSDKGVQIIFYCNGHHCWRSPKSAVAAVKMGYTNVGWLRDGFPSWQKKGYATE